MYHYYLHGEKGNLEGCSQHGSDDTPSLTIECRAPEGLVWSSDLAEINDDLESLYLRVSNLTACAV